jgi:hypothetical protein
MLTYRSQKLTAIGLKVTKMKHPNWIEAFSYEDYLAMFELDSNRLTDKTLDCMSALSSFNATATQQSKQVTSLDPLYAQDKHAIERLIDQQRRLWQDHLEHNSHDPKQYEMAQKKFEHFTITSQLFLDDYALGQESGRYVAWSPGQKLPFADHSFSLALCSHWLFKQPLSLIEVIDCIDELCRVAGEVRIFPLVNAQSQPHHFLGHVMANFQSRHYKISCVAVDFNSPETGGAMLCITSPACLLRRNL